MCLAIPMKLIKIEGNKGIVELSGVKKKLAWTSWARSKSEIT